MGKQNKVKLNNKNINENEDKVFSFVTTIAGIIIILIAAYLIVGIFFTKEIDFSKKEEKDTESTVTIDNKTITAGQIFDQKDESYYVLVYDFDSKLTNLSTFASVYSSKEGSLPIYKVDSGNKINSEFISKDSNVNPTSYNDLKIKSPTLIKIENKTVTSYIENEDEIKKILNEK